jgi:hypothetical protein
MRGHVRLFSPSMERMVLVPEGVWSLMLLAICMERRSVAADAASVRSFKLSPQVNGSWKHTTLVTFDIANGSQPTAGLIFDPDGNLFGNANDGRFGIGIVFRLSPQAGGKWKRTTLLTFNGENGSGPAGGLLLDAAGDLYGSASVEGKRNGGVVFELSPARRKTP